MKDKKITVILESLPLYDSKSAEGLRMGLGLTISNNDVSFVFTGDSVNLLRKGTIDIQGRPEVHKPLSMLHELKKFFYVFSDKKNILKEECIFPVKKITKEEFFKILKESEITIRC